MSVEISHKRTFCFNWLSGIILLILVGCQAQNNLASRAKGVASKAVAGKAGEDKAADQIVEAQNGYLDEIESSLVLDRDKRTNMINEFDRVIKSLDENEYSLENLFNSKALEAQHALDEKIKDLQVYTLAGYRRLLKKKTQI